MQLASTQRYRYPLLALLLLLGLQVVLPSAVRADGLPLFFEENTVSSECLEEENGSADLESDPELTSYLDKHTGVSFDPHAFSARRVKVAHEHVPALSLVSGFHPSAP